MFGNALFCWLRVSWWKERKIFRLKWEIHSLASKWHQHCFASMSSIGVRWHLRQKINAQCAASENANFQIALKYCFFAKHGKILASFYLIWLYLKKKVHWTHFVTERKVLEAIGFTKFWRIPISQLDHTVIPLLLKVLKFEQKSRENGSEIFFWETLLW